MLFWSKLHGTALLYCLITIKLMQNGHSTYKCLQQKSLPLEEIATNSDHSVVTVYLILSRNYCH